MSGPGSEPAVDKANWPERQVGPKTYNPGAGFGGVDPAYEAQDPEGTSDRVSKY